jgi:hypothetical protein
MLTVRFYFIGYYGCGTWPLNVTIESTDAFNAVLQAHAKGWHNLKLMAHDGTDIEEAA